jgi:hypothetical protein
VTDSSLTRRSLLKRSTALAAGSFALSPLVGTAKAVGFGDDLKVAPPYYPQSRFKPEIDLARKLAVITGASRGNGRAVGETLAARGADVIGTSRKPRQCPQSAAVSAAGARRRRPGHEGRQCGDRAAAHRGEPRIRTPIPQLRPDEGRTERRRR